MDALASGCAAGAALQHDWRMALLLAAEYLVHGWCRKNRGRVPTTVHRAVTYAALMYFGAYHNERLYEHAYLPDWVVVRLVGMAALQVAVGWLWKPFWERVERGWRVLVLAIACVCFL